MSTLSFDGLRELLSRAGADPLPAQSTISPAAHLLSRPIDIYRVYLAAVLTTLTGCDPSVAYDAVQSSAVIAKGDLVVPVPRLRIQAEAGMQKKTPAELCIDLAAQFPADHALFSKPVPVGVQLPFYVTPRPLAHLILPYVFARCQHYGSDAAHGARADGREKQRVLVEFSSPNIAKEFHAGHLRSTILGAFLSNLYASMGWHVVRLNYLGDWGKQFGLLAVGWQRYGSEEALARAPLKHLLDVYARIHADFRPEQAASQQARDEGRDTAEIESRGLYAERNAFFRRMEDGDPDALALWQRFRDISIDRYTAAYARLNIHFDEYAGESQVPPATVQRVEQMLAARGVYEHDNGSSLIDFAKHGAPHLGVAIVRGRTGTTTYLLRDVAAVLEREAAHAFDQMVYVVSSEQDLYFRRLFKVVELMGRGDLAARLVHVNFGKVLGMSSRLGSVRLLGDILDEAAAAMHDVMRGNASKYARVADPEAVADAVGISAVMVQDMTGKRINNYPFDMDRMTSFEGDTGPYLQYCHARLCSILDKSGLDRERLGRFVGSDAASDSARLHAALEPDLGSAPCVNLLRLIAQYPDVTSSCLRTLEPSTILTYLFRLAHQLSTSYAVLQVVGAQEGHDVMLARAAVYESARQVLENGMRLLGLTPVTRL